MRILALLSVLAGCGLVFGCSETTYPPHIPNVDLIDECPAWSPVDSIIAFHRGVASNYGPPGVYLISQSGGDVRLLYQDDPVPVGDLRFSPDGTTLAGIQNGQLIALDVRTGALRQLSYTDNGAAEPDWSPDGSAIVYRRIFLDHGEPSDSAGLHILTVASSSDRAVLPGTTEVFGTHPRWSPGDSLIAFAAGSICTIRPDGSGLRPITAPPKTREDRSPSWTPDGTALFYLRTGGAAASAMRFVHADGSGDRMWHSNYGGVYCLSGDGNKVVMTGAVPTSSERVAMVLFVEDVGDASGTSRRQLTIFPH